MKASFVQLPLPLHAAIQKLRLKDRQRRRGMERQECRQVTDLITSTIKHGLDIARRAQLWEGADITRYNLPAHAVRSVRLRLPDDLYAEIQRIMEAHDCACRNVIITALHYGIEDPLSPGYIGEIAH